MKIVLINSLNVEEDKLKQLQFELASLNHEFFYYLNPPISIEEYQNRIKDADVLIIDNIKTTGDVLKAAKKLKYLNVAFTGLDHVDLGYCKEHNITISNASGYSTEAVAELTIGLIISYLRNVLFFDKVTRDLKTKGNLFGEELENKVVGLFGFGKIARRVFELLKPFNVKILTYSHHKIKDLPKDVSQVDFNTLLNESDIISIHTPLNEETRGIFDYSSFKMMKKKPLIINTARGPIIDKDSLIRALKEDLISGAALDVYDKEPPLDSNDPLIAFSNLILLPHIGYFTKEAMIKRFEIIKDNLFNYINGETKNRVNVD